jgi:hypothetical protein
MIDNPTFFNSMPNMSTQTPSKLRAARREAARAQRTKVWLCVGFAILAFAVLVLGPHTLGIKLSVFHAAGLIAGAGALIPFACARDAGHRASLKSLGAARSAVSKELVAARLALNDLVVAAARDLDISERRPCPRPIALRSGRSLAHICLTSRLARRPSAARAIAG